MTEIDCTDNNGEIRFAVVMYGGVSLAIYINGVTQELYNMTRATSQDEKQRHSTGAIYNRISQLLANSDHRKGLENKTQDEIAKVEDANLANTTLSTVGTRFTIDILSGSSAGGINAIFLSKALANNQSVESLKDLWMDEGDIAKLLNDKHSVYGLSSLAAPTNPKSLLNSERMFLKLVEAVKGMEKIPPTKPSKFVNELDLFVTTTDFTGVVLPLRLLDKVVYERKHRLVFNFKYRSDEDKHDFENVHNPMLAFAARATSSFPFAFEPMRLSTAYDLLGSNSSEANLLRQDRARFFPAITNDDLKEYWDDRDLVDGGVLDNKPFSYAIEALSKRRADFGVDRKLLFVEPSPEAFNQQPNGVGVKAQDAPNALDNAVAALITLPGYETIREDLQRILDRNRLIERVNRLTQNIDKDIYNYFEDFETEPVETAHTITPMVGPQTGAAWEKHGFENIIKWKGRSALPYYRLRVASLADDISTIIARKIGVDPESHDLVEMRTVLNIWRRHQFQDYEKNAQDGETSDSATFCKLDKEKKTVLAFLYRFDLKYRLRRLRFVLQRADELFRFDENFQMWLKERAKSLDKIKSETEKAPEFADSKSFERKIGNQRPTQVIWDKKENLEAIRTSVCKVQNELLRIFRELQSVDEALHQPKSDDGQSKHNDGFAAFFAAAADLSKARNDSADERKKDLQSIGTASLEKLIEGRLTPNAPDSFAYCATTQAALKYGEDLDKVLTRARTEAGLTFGPDPGPNDKSIDTAVKTYLKYFYDQFDFYDQISFPIYFESDVGEAVRVDVLRVSPSDAIALIDEQNDQKGRKKLGGDSFFHFGGFLSRVWRHNDIMWGRLDGAERLITALLPDQRNAGLREYFTTKACGIILKEELKADGREDLKKEFAAAIFDQSSGLTNDEIKAKLGEQLSTETVRSRLIATLDSLFLDENEMIEYLKNRYVVSKRLEPEFSFRVVGRSTQIVGKILDGIANDRKTPVSGIRWISRVGLIFSGMVGVASRGSFWQLFISPMLSLLYLFEVFMIAGGLILNQGGTMNFGILALILTVAVNLFIYLLGDYMEKGKFARKAGLITVAVVILVLGLATAYAFSNKLREAVWPKAIECCQQNINF